MFTRSGFESRFAPGHHTLCTLARYFGFAAQGTGKAALDPVLTDSSPQGPGQAGERKVSMGVCAHPAFDVRGCGWPHLDLLHMSVCGWALDGCGASNNGPCCMPRQPGRLGQTDTASKGKELLVD